MFVELFCITFVKAQNIEGERVDKIFLAIQFVIQADRILRPSLLEQPQVQPFIPAEVVLLPFRESDGLGHARHYLGTWMGKLLPL